MDKDERSIVIKAIYNLRYDMDCIGEDTIIEELSSMSDSELLDILIKESEV